MKKDEFEVGKHFWTGSGEWVCTDKGQRTIVAARWDALKDNPAGPPYSVGENVFDEYDQDGCYLEQNAFENVVDESHYEDGEESDDEDETIVDKDVKLDYIVAIQGEGDPLWAVK